MSGGGFMSARWARHWIVSLIIGLAFIQRLYKIEAQAREKNVTEAALKIWRQDQARPVFTRLSRLVARV